MRIFATHVSASASPPHTAAIASGKVASRHQGPPACGRKSSAASTAITQCRAATDHCSSAWSRPAYSSSEPSCSIVSSRWVSGLSTGCRPVSAITTSAKAKPAHQCTGCSHTPQPFAAAESAVRSVEPTGKVASSSVASSSPSTNTEKLRSRAAPINENPFPVSQADSV